MWRNKSCSRIAALLRRKDLASQASADVFEAVLRNIAYMATSSFSTKNRHRIFCPMPVFI